MAITLIKHETPMWVSQLTGSINEVLNHLADSQPDTFWSFTSTHEELSLVSALDGHAQFTKVDGPWALFQVAGVLDFGLTGILNSLTKPMAEAEISIFAISTYNTDYILVKQEVAEQAERVWVASGFQVTG
jgi:hypothetical protein